MINKINHLETLIGSLDKIIKEAKNKGILKTKELYLLNIIHKLISKGCINDLDYSILKKLNNLYYTVLNKYPFLCKYNINIDNDIHIKNNIIKTYINTNPNHAPIITDPEPSEPEEILAPKLCENTISILLSLRIKYIILTQQDLLTSNPDCFFDQYGGYIRYVKITSLPIYGVLLYNEQVVEIGDIINNSTNIGFKPNGNIGTSQLKYTIKDSINRTSTTTLTITTTT